MARRHNCAAKKAMEEVWGLLCPDCGPENYKSIVKAIIAEHVKAQGVGELQILVKDLERSSSILLAEVQELRDARDAVLKASTSSLTTP